MNKIVAIVIVGLSSSIAFADGTTHPVPAGGKKDKVEYKCKFETERKDSEGQKPEEVKCWVEGSFCKEREDRGEKRCSDEKQPIEIKCTNDFRLESRESAVELVDETLWINAEEREKIATIRVKDFPRATGSDNDNRRKADLIISKDEGKALRLEGSCKFEKNEHDFQVL